MARSSHSPAASKALSLEHLFQFRNVAHECLNQMSSPKEWASALNVTDRQVRMWATGEREIPPLRMDQIIRQAKTFLMAERKLEESIDRLLLEQYGPHDRGRF